MSRKQEFVDPPPARPGSASEPLARLVAAMLIGAALCTVAALLI